MKMNEVIRVEGISKMYKLGVFGAGTLRDDVSNFLARFRKNTLDNPGSGLESRSARNGNFWALRDVGFSVNQGEIIGIIGKNGAGKSTLLKILSRITHPTKGEIKIKGRVGSLLEVGTGFHPELTGSENIFLNGAILGMNKAEIKNKFDEIVAFSGIEHHIHTPIKRYSSGMKVRLGFAVAAHLEPEILIIDEVLAVGDVEFQKKCLGKMHDVSNSGRTVLFVSHNMTAVRNLCHSAILLDEGKIIFNGSTPEAVKRYLGGESGNRVHFVFDEKQAPGTEAFRITEIQVHGHNKKIGEPIFMEDDVVINVFHERFNSKNRYDVTLQFKGESGEILFANGSGRMETPDYKVGKGVYKVTIPGNLLNSGIFEVNLLINEDRRRQVYLGDSLISFTVVQNQLETGGWQGRAKGDLYPLLAWNYDFLSK
jgi:lipopolysaccharide transport system ATP-binding protein